ncbi:scarecrow-like protein 34 [Tripterygium wilfordii]|uniref:Scarecrow-like protein 34 n=1 Tax=Tripterygium wilfordii TaxID=458696 RepID=A0A7J7DYN1_TRIWF|nr:scarecrow-like protein 34 [Tripterygium wilfordii]KAF5751437.1 scarecrow-like protein 34 [Tripterygium wilfordii]
MDQSYTGFTDSIDPFKAEDQPSLANSDQYLNLENGFKFTAPSPDFSFFDEIPFPSPTDLDPHDPSMYFSANQEGESSPPPASADEIFLDLSTGWSPEGESSSPSDDSDSSDPVLRYISQMLMEENMEKKPCMFYDPLALQATEKSLYEMIGEQYPASPHQPQIHAESPDSSSFGSLSNSSITSPSNLFSSQLVGEIGEYKQSSLEASLPGDYYLQSGSQPTSQISVNIPNDLTNDNGLSTSELVGSIFGDTESIRQFNKGLEEARKFLPIPNQLVIDLERNNLSTLHKEVVPGEVVKEERIERGGSPDRWRTRKNHGHEDLDLDLDEWRSNKQSAVYVEETELSDLFDKVLLVPIGSSQQECCEESPVQNETNRISQTNKELNGSSGGKSTRGRGRKNSKKKETADLRTLLILCAQAVSVNDCRTANELLKQIRENSSPSGDGTQRLAHYFANGLEARMLGSDTGVHNFYASLVFNKKFTAADMLKAYKTYLSAVPFKKLSIAFANKMILKVAKDATTLHIVDFGILYGFQWPMLIQLLSMRPDGPPKLRITGIELPQAGFRPAERIEETGRRLAKYCERFKVPFEYNPIALKNWETIRIEDLNIKSNEVLAVNCLFRFKNLFDETVEVNCPRDAVLNLIRKMNPCIFVHGIVNGSYNAPFFVTRFREAVFNFSALFDMFDACLPRDDQQRFLLEREFYGREAMNVIAREGLERVERPETYKQWHVRNSRAGFKPMPLDQELMKKLRKKLEVYHKDFVIDEDSHWLLEGWKGRIVYAVSCWEAA